MKVEVSYILNGKFVNRIVSLRSLDRVVANAERNGAEALTATLVKKA